MKLVNIGVANLVVSNLLKESVLNDTLITEAKDVTSKFFETVKGSPILQLEFKVVSALENKQIINEALAIKYIGDTIDLFETYTIEEIDAEREKLKEFVLENDATKYAVDAELDPQKIDLYNAIDTLIMESLKPNDEVNVDNIHESFSVVLNHIKEPKETKFEETPEYLTEEVVEMAINKFNEKYVGMNEADIRLFKQLINATDNEKKELFEEYKSGNISILESLNEENSSDKIAKSLEKISEMAFSVETADSDIVKLHELKKGLI